MAEYARPASLEAAAAAWSAASEPAWLAGGMTLIPTIKQGLASPSDLIDLGALGLSGVERDGEALTIGAMTRHADVAASREVREAIPAVAALAGGIGDAQVRNRGTIGGSLANSDPAADYPAAALGLGASLLTDRREIAADEYFLDLFETALQPGELVCKVRLPIPAAAAYRKFRHPASGYAVAGVFAARFADGLRIAVTGAGPCAFRWRELEADPGRVGSAPLDASRFNADLAASAQYRAHLVRVMAERALAGLG